mgnify:FL=1
MEDMQKGQPKLPLFLFLPIAMGQDDMWIPDPQGL